MSKNLKKSEKDLGALRRRIQFWEDIRDIDDAVDNLQTAVDRIQKLEKSLQTAESQHRLRIAKISLFQAIQTLMRLLEEENARRR